MHVRMIPKSASDVRFAEVASRQPEYTAENISGTIVGIWTPEIFHGVSVAGYHLHFISDDLTFGGHVMDYVISEGMVEVGPVDQLDQRFPVQDRQYLLLSSMLRKLEKILIRRSRLQYRKIHELDFHGFYFIFSWGDTEGLLTSVGHKAWFATCWLMEFLASIMSTWTRLECLALRSRQLIQLRLS